ncbi:MAG: GDP-mannose 4,6-dehydratase [Gemmatirosa sp.]|nr:GDP-mannose 4,6-dehydratase [Gemmatirosa sp.]
MDGSPPRRALITGAAGFVGRWLARSLVDGGWTVTGAALAAPPADDAILGSARDAVRWISGDVRDRAHLAEALDAARPDVVFHLAGVTFVPAAGDDPGTTAEVNVVAAARLLGLVRERRRAGTLDPAVIVTGSAEQYGRHDAAELPLREDAAQRPHTVYAATKVAQEAVALEAWRSEGVRVVATRSFNHSGPGQAPHFLLPGLVRRALALRDAGGGALRMGNQSPVRDFLHVSDVVAAYIALADRGRPGEAYNVASGVGTSAGELARRVLARTGLDLPIESDPALVRPADVPALVGDASKLRAATGWTPRRTLDDLLDDLISRHDAPSD